MQMTIDNPEALVERADRAYAGLVYGSRPAVLELALAPGLYEGLTLSLTTAYDAAHVDVTIRAEDAQRPPAFRNSGIRIKGGTVTLEHLIFEGVSTAGMQLAVNAVGDVVVENCAFLHAVGADTRALPIIQFQADDQRRQLLSVRDCWLVGNAEREPTALLDCSGLPGKHFNRITFERTAFLNNRFSQTVQPGAADEIIFDGCFIQSPGQFAVASYLTTRMTIARSAVIAPTVAAVVNRQYDASGYTMPARPALVTDSRLYLTEPPGENPHAELSRTIAAGAPAFDAFAIADHLAAEDEFIWPPDIGKLAWLLGLDS